MTIFDARAKIRKILRGYFPNYPQDQATGGNPLWFGEIADRILSKKLDSREKLVHTLLSDYNFLFVPLGDWARCLAERIADDLAPIIAEAIIQNWWGRSDKPESFERLNKALWVALL